MTVSGAWIFMASCGLWVLRNLRTIGNAVVNNFQNPFPLFAFERQARRAHPFRTEAAFLHGEFDVLNELRVGVEVEERGEPCVEIACLVPFAMSREFPKVLVLAREGDTAARHPAIDAEDGAL